MDEAIKAKRSQALIDSIEELLALEQDVSLATERSNHANSEQSQQVMVPLTGVAFMPGTIAGDSIMVGLGQDYYVERTPRQAQEILRRRMDDLSEQARVLEEGALLVPRPPPPPPQQQQQQQQTPRKPLRKPRSLSRSKMKWAKGFLANDPHRPARGQASLSQKGETASANVQEIPADEVSSPSPTEIADDDSGEQERVVEMEDGDESAHIMEIREWLDEVGNQTSVDVTDLGKVLRGTPKAIKSQPPPANVGSGKGKLRGPATASPTESGANDTRSSSELDGVFARLEQQEKEAEKEAASPSLGPQWKKGFLEGGAKRPARVPSAVATTPALREANQDSTGAGSAAMERDGASTASTASTASRSHAFRERVVEKTTNVVASAPPILDGKAAAAPTARVSRFKARRQGL